jgi:hypothetical protein
MWIVAIKIWSDIKWVIIFSLFNNHVKNQFNINVYI